MLAYIPYTDPMGINGGISSKPCLFTSCESVNLVKIRAPGPMNDGSPKIAWWISPRSTRYCWLNPSFMPEITIVGEIMVNHHVCWLNLMFHGWKITIFVGQTMWKMSRSMAQFITTETHWRLIDRSLWTTALQGSGTGASLRRGSAGGTGGGRVNFGFNMITLW